MKLYYISYLRALATLLVVLYHCLCFYTPIWSKDTSVYVSFYIYLSKVLQNIHMPLFFFISGYLFFHLSKQGKYNDLKHFVITKTKRLLIPFFFWSIIVFCFISTKTLSSYIYNGASHLWFCGSLFLIFICFKFFRKAWFSSKKTTDFFVWSILFVFSVLVMRFDLPAIPAKAVHYAYVFFAGMLFSKYNIVLRNYHLLGFIPLFILPLITQQFPGQHILLQAIGFYSTASLFCFVKNAITPSDDFTWKKSLINFLDRHSMGIYLIHHIIIQSLILSSSFKNIMTDYYCIVPWLLFLAVLLMSIALSALMKKNNITSNLIGG